MIGAFQSSAVPYCSGVKFFPQCPLLKHFPVAVVFLGSHGPGFHTSRNSNSTIPIDVIRVKSCVDSFHDLMCVPVRVLIHMYKLHIIP